MARSSNVCVLTISFAGAFCSKAKILVDLGGVIYLRLVISVFD